MNFKFKNLIEVIRYFKDEKTCYDFLEQQIWHEGNAACPHCGSLHVYTRKNRSVTLAEQGIPEYKCAEKGCNRNFTVKVGTIFEASKLPLQSWFAAIWLCTTSSKGISSANLAKQLSITQKSAWFVLSRIREMFKETCPTMLEGEIEIDETYWGGKEKNKHKSKRASKGTGSIDKSPMVGLLQRNGNMVLKVLDKGTSNGLTIKPIVRAYVSPNATIYTDGFGAYKDLDQEFAKHGVVQHSQGEYVVDGIVHTNNIEGFWGIMKRGLNGVYHFASHKHLQRYCDEYSYRFNNRNEASVDKFAGAVSQVIKARITYQTLIGK